VIEKLVENWLTSVNELGFQLPFCEVLLSKGYHVLHVSSHGPGEHGKDIIARDSLGKLWAFQLKGGDIRLSNWREIRGEVEELVRLPVIYPGVRANEHHTPVLVTNGTIVGDARESITRFAQKWEADGSMLLEVWAGRELLAQFLEAHDRFLPTKLNDVRDFVDLYVGEPESRLPRAKLSRFLERLVDTEAIGRRPIHAKRAIESMILTGAYIIQQYEGVGNHISAAEGWTVIAASILHTAQREGLQENYFLDSLQLVWGALERNLGNLEREVLDREDFFERRLMLADSTVYGTRTLTTFGWVATATLLRKLRDEPKEIPKNSLSRIFRREFKNLKVATEADWPGIMSICLFLEQINYWPDADRLLGIWSEVVIRANYGKNAQGIPSPYWLPERAIAKATNLLPPDEDEQFGGKSFTLMSAMDMLVRRLCRQRVTILWPSVSRLYACDFKPDHEEDWFLWSCEKGELKAEEQPLEVSWNKWRSRASRLIKSNVPTLLLRYPEWLLPFSLTFPHRVNRSMSALIDSVIGRRVQVVNDPD
jgi:hypothetical protein